MMHMSRVRYLLIACTAFALMSCGIVYNPQTLS